eukprot:TRINITY_DN326_c1_g1_i1.p2 TRINITY_DN326_c1_g1~~TRINITY_DN326_c1_g1_i1.p2  ORF type:complete len:61 (+),score=4.08 TRINITY_DN326_c1_g1_i1:146-328(+)
MATRSKKPSNAETAKARTRKRKNPPSRSQTHTLKLQKSTHKRSKPNSSSFVAKTLKNDKT